MLNSEVKETIYYALIISQTYCKDDADRKFVKKFNNSATCWLDSRIDIVKSRISFVALSENYLGTFFMRVISLSKDRPYSSTKMAEYFLNDIFISSRTPYDEIERG